MNVASRSGSLWRLACRRLARESRLMMCLVSICYRVATDYLADGRARSTLGQRIREASRSRASDSPSSGEYMEVRTARPDEE